MCSFLSCISLIQDSWLNPGLIYGLKSEVTEIFCDSLHLLPWKLKVEFNPIARKETEQFSWKGKEYSIWYHFRLKFVK